MKHFKRVDEAVSGCSDAVEGEVECVFMRKVRRGPNGKIAAGGKNYLAGKKLPCKLLASYENGVITFSVRDENILLNVALPDIMAILKEASDASAEARKADAAEKE